MKRFKNTASVGVASLIMAVVTGCSDGGDSNGNQLSDVAIRFSDAPVEAADKVMITVDYLRFVPVGADGDSDTDESAIDNSATGTSLEEIVVDSFTSEELGIEDSPTFQIDLLDVVGNDSRLVLDSVELPVGDYKNLLIGILDEDVDFSFVEVEGEFKPIKVPSGELKLGAFTVGNLSTQSFVVEFDLRRSMTYNPGPDRYILKPRGVRVVALDAATSVSGVVDLGAMHTLAPCDAKPDTAINNLVYLYEGINLDVASLSDMFESEDPDTQTPEVADAVPTASIAPSASAVLDETGGYLFSYLEPGEYTVAFTCEGGDDDPVQFDEFAVPSPTSALAELAAVAGQAYTCDFPSEAGCVAQ